MASREIRRMKDRKAKTAEEGRKPAGKTITSVPSLVILGLILLGLIYVGGSSASIFNIGKVRLGQYDGRDIVWEPGNFFARKIGMITQQNKNVSTEEAFRSLMPYMVFHTALMIEAEKTGFVASQKEVEQFIKSIGYAEQYNKLSNIERLASFNFYKEIYVETRMVEQMSSTMDNKALTDFAAQMGSVEKNFRYVAWNYSDFPQEEVVKYALENKSLFRTILLSRLSAKKEQEARDALNKIRNNTSSFEEQREILKSDAAIAAISQPYNRLLTVIGNKEAVDAIFNLKQGEISDVVQVGTDWIIYRCEGPVVDADMANPEVMKEVKDYVTNYEKGKIEGYFEEKAKAFSAQAAERGFVQSAAAMGMKTWETGFFPLNINGLSFLPSIPAPADGAPGLLSAQADVVFFSDIFALIGNAVSAPVLLDDKVVVLQLIAERKADDAALAKIKTGFTSQMANQVMQFYQLTYYNPASLEFHPYYSLFVDRTRMGTPAEQEEMFQKGLEIFRTKIGG